MHYKHWIMGAILSTALVGCWHGMAGNAGHHMGGGRGQGMMGQGPIDPVARGGRGYDKWWAEYGLPEPALTHPSYPAAGKAKGSATWRCKECHGWDYLGRDGAYGSGSHATGIVGIRAAASRSTSETAQILSDDTHRYEPLLPADVLNQIALFVSQGQINMADLIGPDLKASGSAAAGKRTYDDNCAVCHADDGRELDFNAGGDTPEFLGTIAVRNPWEALHKLRNGQPGESGPEQSEAATRRKHHHHWVMSPMREKLTVAQQADLLAHLQTLPTR